MTIEQNIFKRAKFDFDQLIVYGFQKSEDLLVYTKTFMNGDFRAVIKVDKLGKISGEVYEADSNDIYFPLRVESMSAGFAGHVREEYENILNDIKIHCCQQDYFLYPQANRLAQRISEKYGDNPVFPWDKFDGYGVFKNPDNNKWYALIMNIDASILNKSLSGKIDVVNIKLDKEKIPYLIKQDGFFPAYHMNKKSWITVILDDSVTDNLLFELLEESHTYTLGARVKGNNKKTEWLVPANPKYFDIEKAFCHQKEIIWKQSAIMKIGDIVYMYVGAPISAVLYKCEVTEVDIPYEYSDKNIKITRVMRIKKLKKYAKDIMPFGKLKKLGVLAVRGPRICPQNVIDKL